MGVNDTVRCRFAGLPSTGNADLSCAKGSALTPLMAAGSMATAAATTPLANSSWAMRPPKECPTRMGLTSGVPMSCGVVVDHLGDAHVVDGIGVIPGGDYGVASPGHPGAEAL